MIHFLYDNYVGLSTIIEMHHINIQYFTLVIFYWFDIIMFFTIKSIFKILLYHS